MFDLECGVVRHNGSRADVLVHKTHVELPGVEIWQVGEFDPSAIDTTFAHELGHFIFNACAINTGRLGLASSC